MKKINIKQIINDNLIIKIFIVITLSFIICLILLNKKHSNMFTIIDKNPLIGIDISNHQGEINWDKLSHNNVDFIFIKATEGLNFKDPFFKNNWKKASEKKFLKGAYHFFRTGESGINQAENFINTVSSEKNTLPPVLDLEIVNGNKYIAIREIKKFLIKLESFYKKKPIIYVNKHTFEIYIRGFFDNYIIWFADYAKNPFYSKEIWTFWQYTDKGILSGINEYVDFNIFNGTKKDLIKLTK